MRCLCDGQGAAGHGGLDDQQLGDPAAGHRGGHADAPGEDLAAELQRGPILVQGERQKSKNDV